MQDWLMGFVRPHLRDGILAVIGAVFAAGLNLVPPALSRLLVNNVLIGHQLQWLWPIIGASIGFAILFGVFSFMQAYLSERLGQAVLRRMRDQLYDHLTGLSYSFHDSVQTGQLMSRLTSDVQWVSMFFSSFFTQGTQVLFTLVFVIAAIAILDWQLALVLLGLMPFLTLMVLRFDHRIRPAFRAIRQQFAVMTTQLQENITGVRVVKAFGQEPREADTFNETLDVLFERNLDTARLQSSFFPLFGLIGGAYGVVVFLFGGWQAIHHIISVGSLVAMSSYVVMMMVPLQSLGFVLNLYAQFGTAGQRLWELMQEEATIVAPPKAHRPQKVSGAIEMTQVSSAYRDAMRPALTGISFKVEPGQSVALVGPTGAGKTSVIALIPRLYDVTSGSVTVDGVDVRQWDPVWLRRHIGVVPQETFLFSATVRENIAYGRPEATFEEVRRAAEMAQAAEFIDDLARGYDTIIGERGIGLSGGQRQRIAIARALLVDPPIIILDDATASVDLETEAAIQEATRRLLYGRTAIVVAHRLSSLQAAHEILVIDDGRIVQRGRHPQLVGVPGIYRDVHDIQSRDQRQVLGGTAS
ncbi:MAG: ABC transporter ATP-binding protein [Thermaerobacter sp.]|nr:ABC transporter ATP-binding protein [Thermaerobacter sp.]